MCKQKVISLFTVFHHSLMFPISLSVCHHSNANYFHSYSFLSLSYVRSLSLFVCFVVVVKFLSSVLLKLKMKLRRLRNQGTHVCILDFIYTLSYAHAFKFHNLKFKFFFSCAHININSLIVFYFLLSLFILCVLK